MAEASWSILWEIPLDESDLLLSNLIPYLP